MCRGWCWDAQLVSEYIDNLVERLLSGVGVFAPCLRVNCVVPWRGALDHRFTSAWSECREVLEGVAAGHDEPIDNTQCKDVASDVVARSILGHSFRGHELPDTSKLLT